MHIKHWKKDKIRTKSRRILLLWKEFAINYKGIYIEKKKQGKEHHALKSSKSFFQNGGVKSVECVVIELVEILRQKRDFRRRLKRNSKLDRNQRFRLTLRFQIWIAAISGKHKANHQREKETQRHRDTHTQMKQPNTYINAQINMPLKWRKRKNKKIIPIQHQHSTKSPRLSIVWLWRGSRLRRAAWA